MRSSLVRVWCVVAALSLSSLAACSGEPDVDIDQRIAALAEQAPPFQQEILSDGEVTPSEYEKAVLADRACVEQAGYVPDPPQWERGELGFTVTADYTGSADSNAADEQFLSTLASCASDFSRYVGSAWALRLVPNDDERDELRPVLIACLRAAGLDIAQDADSAAIDQALTSMSADAAVADGVRACMDQNARYFAVVE